MADFHDIIDRELSERRKSAIYFTALTAAMVIIAVALLVVLR